jgi:hypothetical protein
MIFNILAILLTLLSPTPRHSTDYRVMGSPTISRQTFCNILASYHSPAAGQCNTFYTQGLAYGVDPVMWLAWFKMENEFFTDGGSSLRNKNPGNLRCGSHYCRYASFTDGSAALYKLLKKYATEWHRPTVDLIVPMYAPASDGNNPAWYIATVKKLVNRWRAESNGGK